MSIQHTLTLTKQSRGTGMFFGHVQIVKALHIDLLSMSYSIHSSQDGNTVVD